MTRFVPSSLMLVASLSSSAIALAQDQDSESAVKYRDRTEIDFDEVDVTGELVKPQGQLLLERKKASFNPLIHFREDFDLEMRQSIDEVK